MRDTVFPRWQGAFLAIFLLADGLYVPASPAAVRTLALGGMLAAAVTFIWLKLLAALGERDLESLCLHKFPRPLTRIGFLLVGIACLCGVLRTLVRLSAFWQETAFSGIPRVLTAAVVLFVGWRAGRRGRTAVAMWAYPMLFLTGAVVLLSLAVTLPDCDPAHFAGFAEKFTLSMPLLGGFVWFLLPLMLCAQGKNLPAARACTVGALAGGAGLALISLRAWMVLGAGAARLAYPAFAAAGVFSVGDFLQRGEVVFGCALALCEVVRVALLVTLAYTVFRTVFGRKR